MSSDVHVATIFFAAGLARDRARLLRTSGHHRELPDRRPGERWTVIVTADHGHASQIVETG
jgi:hypothetical protein